MQHRPNGQYTTGYVPSYIIIKGVFHFIFIWRYSIFAITEVFHRFYYFVTATFSPYNVSEKKVTTTNTDVIFIASQSAVLMRSVELQPLNR